MSSETKFKCNFCGKKIVTDSINQDFMGFCIYHPRKVSTDLFDKLNGPHICHTCVEAIITTHGGYFEEAINDVKN